MKSLSLKTIARWSKGSLNTNGNATVKDVIIDSRNSSCGSLFFCIKGKKTDGHNFVKDVKKSGGYSIGEKDFCDITVSDSVKALGDVAREYRKILNPTVIGITGSNGKTTTTQMIGCVLSKEFNITYPERSFNNQIGLPITLLKMDENTEVAVFEMGANHTGEIGYLSRIARPDIGVIINIGLDHIGYLRNQDNIRNTKFELADFIVLALEKSLINPAPLYEAGRGQADTKGSILIYNYDQKEIRVKIKEYNLKCIGFGFDRGADLRCEVLKQTAGYSLFKLRNRKFKINVFGIFNIYNALAAIAVCVNSGVPLKKISSHLEKFKPLFHRVNNIVVGSIEIIDDSYNANPTSVVGLFNELLKIYPQKNIIAVLGEMRELGIYSRKLHREVAQTIAKNKNIKYILAGGKYADFFIEGAQTDGFNKKRIYKFKSNADAAAIIRKIYKEDCLVVLKASRGERLEEVMKYI